MQNITIEDIVSLAKHIPSHGVLIQTLRNHPGIDFESVELVGDGLVLDDPKASVGLLS